MQVAELIVRSAQLRRESRGLHYSRDYPQLAAPAAPTILVPLSPTNPYAAMYRTLLKSKIHRATATHANCTTKARAPSTKTCAEAANMVENEQVHIWNINNGERFITYAIKGERGSGMIR